jgi:hypothetical protein
MFRRTILPFLFIVWGGLLVIREFAGMNASYGNAAYNSGAHSAWIIGVVMLVAGAASYVRQRA